MDWTYNNIHNITKVSKSCPLCSLERNEKWQHLNITNAIAVTTSQWPVQSQNGSITVNKKCQDSHFSCKTEISRRLHGKCKNMPSLDVSLEGCRAIHTITLVYALETKQHGLGTRISKWTCHKLETQRPKWNRWTSKLAQGLKPKACPAGSLLQDLRSRFLPLSLRRVVSDGSLAPEVAGNWATSSWVPEARRSQQTACELWKEELLSKQK